MPDKAQKRPSDPTSLGSWVLAIKSALDARGLDSGALLDAAGLDAAQLAAPGARFPLDASTRLWQLAVEASGDPCFGLTVAEHVNHTTFHALGISLLASSSLLDAFERLLRYFRVVTDAGTLEFGPYDDGYRFALTPVDGPVQPSEQALDAFMVVNYGMCRMLYGNGFRARRVRFKHAPPPCIDRYVKIFRQVPEFGAEENALYLDADIVTQPLASANPELAQHNEEFLARLLARVPSETLVTRVRGVLQEQLPRGEPSQEAVAKALHMSLRNLQRKLAEEGSSYKAVLDELRQELACRYLGDADCSVASATYLLGFSDSSSFSRAFKRWTGVAPGAWRQQRGMTE